MGIPRRYVTNRGQEYLILCCLWCADGARIHDRQLGQLFMMGFDGTTVTDQVRVLIEKYFVGSILLTAKNLKCATLLFLVLLVLFSCFDPVPTHVLLVVFGYSFPALVLSCPACPASPACPACPASTAYPACPASPA